MTDPRRVSLFGSILLVSLFAVAAATAATWQDIADPVPLGNPGITATRYRTLLLGPQELRSTLDAAPLRRAGEREQGGVGVLLELPLPDGGMARFRIFQAPVVAPALLARYPSLATWAGQGIDEPTATVRCDFSRHGFHAAMIGPRGTVYIDPYRAGDTLHYLSYDKAALVVGPTRRNLPERSWGDRRMRQVERGSLTPRPEAALMAISDLRTYRMAVAATGEYTTYHGGTVADGLAAIVVSLNRINQVFEHEFALHLELVANNDLIVYTDPLTDPYTNSDVGAMIGENIANLDAVIGTANYDLGHAYGTAGGGVAGFVICEAGKAAGVTGIDPPVGDPFYIDYVAHEMGHQLHGSHTFASCGGGGSGATSLEPGSGSTIMSYAGICGAGFDLQPHSDEYFQSFNIFDEIGTTSRLAVGSTCGTFTFTGNQVPQVDAGPGGWIIPRLTPFELSGSAVDPDGDPLSYQWEEVDAGDGTTPGDPLAPPFFRSWPPVAGPVRVFPRLSDLVAGTTNIGETLADVDRTLIFRLVARDNRAGAGAVAYAGITVDVTTAAGPFRVTDPNTAEVWVQGTSEPVSWDVAMTDLPPVACATVDIRLSLDGGFNYPILLAGSEPNDGAGNVLIPNTPTVMARVRVQCADNVFFDLSDVDFTISGIPDFALTASPAATTVCAGSDAMYNIDVGSILGFTNVVTLSAPASPGATTLFTPNPVLPPSTSLLTVAGAAPGSYSFAADGSDGAVARSTRVDLTVVGAPPSAPATPSPADGSIDVVERPTLSWAPVNGATGYELQLATDPGFTAILASATLSVASYLPIPLAYQTRHYWRVRGLNICGPGAWSTWSFTTVRTPLCDGSGLLIPDGDPTGGVSGTIVSTRIGRITDLDLNILVNHSWVGDLDMTLEHVDSGTMVLLMNQPNGPNCSGDDIDARFDDSAVTPVANSCTTNVPSIAGPVQPDNPLAAYNGEDIAGQWRLTVHDNVAIDSGAVVEWCLIETVAGPGESSGSSLAPLLVTWDDRTLGTVNVSFENPCGSTGNNLYHGPLADVATYGWSGEMCDIGSGPVAPGLDLGSGSRFFVVVGHNGTTDGSYGIGVMGMERPPYPANTCGQVQNLTARCD